MVEKQCANVSESTGGEFMGSHAQHFSDIPKSA